MGMLTGGTDWEDAGDRAKGQSPIRGEKMVVPWKGQRKWEGFVH